MEQTWIKFCNRKGSQSPSEMGAELSYTQEEIATISKKTVEQWKSKEWFKQKSGFITGSIAQRAFTMQKSFDQGLKRGVSCLVKKIACPQSAECASKVKVADNPQNARDWALKYEESACLLKD